MSQICSGFSDKATLAVPTLLDFARMVARSITPRLDSSSNTLFPTWMKPGEVSTTLSGRYWPDARAAAMMNGLMLEPGSKMSVTARLRYRAGFNCSRSFGLYEGWSTMASTSPVSTSMTITEPALRAVVLHRLLQFPVGQVLNAQIDAGDEVAAGPRGADALDVLDAVPEHVLDDALRPILAVHQLIVAELQALLALIVDRGEPDHVAGHFARRVIAAVLALQIHARDPECLDMSRLLGRHGALEIQELAIEVRGDAARQHLLILLQRLGEPGKLVDVVVQLLRVDPDAVHRRAHGQRLAGSVGDRAAVGRDLDHAHRTVVALLGEKAVIDQLQLDRARREADRAEHHQPQNDGGAPAVGRGAGGAFAQALLHGRTIRTSRVCGRLICSFALATRSTNAFEDQ